MRRVTPLRYPGGKSELGAFFGQLISRNRLSDAAYVEPFAGGAGVAIALLLGEWVDTIFINDIDRSVYSFWKCVSDRNDELCSLIENCRLSVREWRKQKAVHDGGTTDELALGFATFYLNRTNRSGILNGGLIGGKNQAGEWKMDARFNRKDLVARIRRIGRYRSRIHVSNDDAVAFLNTLRPSLPARSLVYLDPPYFDKGQHLYTNFYEPGDHATIAEVVRDLERPWVVSYDDHPKIRKLYSGYRSRRYSLTYSARESRGGSEVIFFSERLSIPPLPFAAANR